MLDSVSMTLLKNQAVPAVFASIQSPGAESWCRSLCGWSQA